MLNTPWSSGPTGDMTLAVTDSTGKRIARIDMLQEKTMQADTNAERLVRSLNDLAIIAYLPCLLDNSPSEAKLAELLLPYPEAGISPVPWSIRRTPKAHTILDKDGHRVAQISWKTEPSQLIVEGWDVIEKCLPIVNEYFK